MEGYELGLGISSFWRVCTPGKLSSLFQLGSFLAREFSGCSNPKPFPSEWALAQFSAAISAIAVSMSILLLFALGMDFNRFLIPEGSSGLLTGLGGNLTPGIGLALAIENVAQFGAQ